MFFNTLRDWRQEFSDELGGAFGKVLSELMMDLEEFNKVH